MARILSVDIGTTYSAAAVSDGQSIEMCSLGTRAPTIPTTVALRPDGTVVVGEAAERRGLSEPTRVSREFKRRLGDPVPIVIGGTPYGAETLMAHVLRWIIERATEEEGGPPERVVLTHPADFGPYKLDLLEQVGRLAGLRDIEMLTEPEAAAVQYFRQERIDPDEVVAVYDLGGGTFDGALIREVDGRFELVGRPEGMDRFGGIDLDEAVFVHVRDVLGSAFDGLDTTDPAVVTALVRLRDDCRVAKESLSSDTEATVPVMLPNLHTEVRLTRTEFEDMIRPRLRETLSTLDRVLLSADLAWSDVSRVLLVGGSSRIPLVSEMVRSHTGCAVALDTNPKHAIALGAAAAAIAGATRSGAHPIAPVVVAESLAEHTEVGSSPEPSLEPSPIAPGQPSEPSNNREEVDVDAAQPDAADRARPRIDERRRRSIIASVTVMAIVAALVVGALTLFGGDGDSDIASDSDSGVVSASSGGGLELANDDSPIRVLATYLADYATPDQHGSWGAWANAIDADPPFDIAADHYPIVGPYNSADPAVIEQHMLWLREAGIDGILVPWRGGDSISGEAAPLLLDIGAEFGVQVAFAIEFEQGSPDEFVAQAEELLSTHGLHPNYLRTLVVDHEGRRSPRALLVLIIHTPAEPEQWVDAIAAVRQMAEGTAVLIASLEPQWVDVGNVDGVIGGGTDDGSYEWANAIGEATWYVPTVGPGASARRVGEPVAVERREGQSYRESWDRALAPRMPSFVLVDSFNHWAFGTQIEPAMIDEAPERFDPPYLSYTPLPPDGYVLLTRELVDSQLR